MSKKGGSQRLDKILAQMVKCVRGEGLPPNKRMSAKEAFNAWLFILHAHGLISEKIYVITLAGAKKVDVPEEYTEVIKATEQEVEEMVNNLQEAYLKGGGNANTTNATSGTTGS
jgi:Ni,Fe-hydrogenase maturation factor